MSRCSWAVLASMLCLPSEAWPQEQVKPVSPITVGSRVRLRAPTAVQGRIEGTVAEMDDATLVVKADDRMLVRLPRQAITQAEVSTGRHRKALKGMIIGAGIGAVIYQTTVSDNCAGAIGVCTTSHAAAAGIGVVAGGIWGAGIGALFKGDRWNAVPQESVRVSLAPTRGRGFGLSVSTSW